MVQTIKISREEMGFINDLLNLPGDEIYQKEEMGIEELVEKNYTLYQGYERAVSLLTEDIEMYA